MIRYRYRRCIVKDNAERVRVKSVEFFMGLQLRFTPSLMLDLPYEPKRLEAIVAVCIHIYHSTLSLGERYNLSLLLFPHVNLPLLLRIVPILSLIHI